MPFDGHDILVEVKEFRATREDASLTGGFFDPYHPLREKIEQGRDKFKKLKAYCCSLVLYNVNKPLVLLDWQHIYGAMLGNLGFEVPLDIPGRPKPADSTIRSIFMGGGKMIRRGQGIVVGVQNRTISSIVVMERIPVGQRLFHAELGRRESELGRKFSAEQVFRQFRDNTDSRFDLRRQQLRVVVHENPYATTPLPSAIFRGPYDERYGSRDGRIQLLYRGDAIAQLPERE